MRKIIIIISLILAFVFAVIQFFQPCKNQGGISPDHIFEKEKMPIKAYVKMHKEAKLSDSQIAALCGWTEQLSLELIEPKEN